MDTNNYEIILAASAKEDLDNIYEYISKNPNLKSSANKLMNKIENAVLRLEDFPYSCAEVKVKLQNMIYRRLIIDKYVALYRVEEQLKQVHIIHIYYAKQDYLRR